MTSQVVQKVTSTDNAIVRFNGTTGDVQNSSVIIDDNNNVGIGGTPSAFGGYTTVSLDNASIGGIYNIKVNGTETARLQAYSGIFNVAAKGASTNLTFETNGAERMRIDANGSVGMRVNPIAGAGTLQMPNIDSLGFQGPYGYIWANVKYTDGYRYITSAKATAFDMFGGNFIWRTAPSGTAGNPITWNTAMTLDASGNLLVGTSSGGIQNANSFQYLVSNGQSYVTHITGTTGGTAYAVFGYGETQIGSIAQNGTTAVSYNTTSDYRLKENIRPADCKRFMDIKFVDYERIDGRHECGIIAHELQEIYPDLVFGEKDATEIRKVEISPAIEEVKDEDGNVITEAVEAVYEEQEFPVYQQVNYIGLIARIGTVVQQQAKLIEAMQLEINELKGAK